MEQGERSGGDGAARFTHEVVFYDGAAARPAALLPFIRGGVAAGEPVLVALPGAAIPGVREGVGGSAGVEFVDITEFGGNPARIIPVWRRFVEEHAGEGAVRGIGEPAWVGRREVEMTEASLHEALLNVAFDDGPAWRLLCPYDSARLPGWVIDEARRTHPLDLAGASHPGYAGHDYAHAAFGSRLAPAPGTARRFVYGIGELAEVRDLVQAAGARAGVADAAVDDLVLAAHELATNSVRHAGGKGVLLLWTEPDALVVEIRDGGRIADPMVGRAEPPFDAQGGRGIWMVNQLCDLVQVRSDETGTQVRLYTWL